LSKANGKQQAIIEAKKIDLIDNHLYHALLGELYNGVDNTQSLAHLQQALSLARSASDRNIIAQKIAQLTAGSGDQR
jgi:RNA polymerase sigma-70 factor (ECF subfamily)